MSTVIERFRLLQLKYAMRLELSGMKHSRGSVIAAVKKQHRLKGNKQAVYAQFCALHGLDK